MSLSPFALRAPGAAEGAPFISDHIIDVTTKAFDDFADSGMDKETNKKLLGI